MNVHLVGLFLRDSQPSDPYKLRAGAISLRQTWEYHYGYNLDTDQINELGADGWELVAVVGEFCNQFHFKRPKL